MKNLLVMLFLLVLMGIAITSDLLAVETDPSSAQVSDHHDGDNHGDENPGHSHDDDLGKESKAIDSHGIDAVDNGHGDSHGVTQAHDDHGNEAKSGGDGHGHGEAATDAELDDNQRRMAGIETLVVKRESLNDVITAPGEVALNAYLTTRATPRIAAQVIKRHVFLGDVVRKGTPLVTLSSVEMAEAQGMLMEADIERSRVEKLGRKVVSEKRFIAATIRYQQAYARVRAYGMTVAQIHTLLKQKDATKAAGEFALLALRDGTVISDDFIIGELVEPGHLLFEISDESTLWIEAKLTPESATNVAIGSQARVNVRGQWLQGKVTRSRHTLDETTRTLAVHIDIANPGDLLHPGQFVTVVIESKNKRQGIVVPLAAVLRAADGDWQVFVEVAPGRFEPKEVEVLSTVGGKMLIEGIEEGTTVVSKGAFFVQSEIAKSGFEVHNH